MSGSLILVVLLVLAGILYLLLRRRGGSRQSDAIKPVRSAEVPSASPSAPDLKPFRPGEGSRAKTGLPPRPSDHDSGSSHPAYPVAPAKYSGAPAIRSEGSSRYDSAGAGGERVQRPMATQPGFAGQAGPGSDPHAPAPTEPWYPEAPARYTDDAGIAGPQADADGQGRPPQRS